MAEKRNYFPLALSLAERPAVVIGGGQLAEHRVQLLLESGAVVTVVSPELTPTLNALWREGRFRWVARRYRRGDVAGNFIVLATTSDPGTNQRIFREGRTRCALVNIADDPLHCDFILPAIVRRGDIQLAITTNGRLPALSGWLRRKLDSLLPQDLGQHVEALEPLRKKIAAAWPVMQDRRKAWNDVLDKTLPRF